MPPTGIVIVAGPDTRDASEYVRSTTSACVVLPFGRVTVRNVDSAGAVSANEETLSAAASPGGAVAASSSRTVTVDVAFGSAVALAVRTTLLSPSARLLLTGVARNTAVLCPTGIVTLAGTPKRAALPEAKSTVRGNVRSAVFRDTV